jgi:hypothetical protein
MQPGQAIYRGEAGTYYGYDYEAMPAHVDGQVRTIDRYLQQQELIYLGRLNCSQFEGIQVYTYATFDQRTSVSLLLTERGLGGIDCVSKFSDGSFLTTTTNRVLQNSYDKQGLYRKSYPQLNALELLAQHQSNLKEMQMRCGAAQKTFRDLSNMAHMVDEYTVRQKTNTGHGLWKWIGGFKILFGI